MNSFCYSMTNGIEPELYKNEAKEECVCDVIKGPARENPLRLPPTPSHSQLYYCQAFVQHSLIFATVYRRIDQQCRAHPHCVFDRRAAALHSLLLRPFWRSHMYEKMTMPTTYEPISLFYDASLLISAPGGRS